MFRNRLFLVPYPFVSSYRHCTEDASGFRASWRGNPATPGFQARVFALQKVDIAFFSRFAMSSSWFVNLSICQHCLFLIRVTYSLYGLHVGRDVQTVGQFRGFKPLVSIAERASVVAWKRSNVCCAIPDVFGRESFVSNGEVLR